MYQGKNFLIKFKQLSILLILLAISNVLISQTLTRGQKPDPLFAKYCLKFHNYYDGLQEFKALLRENPENDFYRWGVGYCHLHLNVDKSESIPFFLKVLSGDKADQEIWYDLGEAYMVTYQFDKAKDAFINFIKSGVNDEHAISAVRMLEMISNAEIVMKNPVNVSIENVGEYINTPDPEFSPYINAGEKYMVFSSQNVSNSGRYRHEDGYYASDVYNSNFKFGKWRKKKGFSSMINSMNIEQNGYMSSNAAKLYVYKEDLLGKNINHYVYTKRGRSYGYPEEIFIQGVDMAKVNSLVISSDNQWIVFSALNESKDRSDLDLYYSKYNPEGYWAEPSAFDSTINTIYDESFPYFTPRNSSFIFASKGHNSMGGYDLFQCDLEIDSLVVGKPKNIGYPVNTPMDDKTISFNLSGRYAYISTLREEGIGDLDIYRVIFKDVSPIYSYIHGSIYDQDSIVFTKTVMAMNQHIDTLNFPINHEYKRLLLKEKDSVKAMTYLKNNKIAYEKLDVKISVIDIKNNKKAGEFIVQERSARFAIILPPGEYRLVFSRHGFQDFTIDNLIIEDFDLRNQDLEFNILLQKNK